MDASRLSEPLAEVATPESPPAAATLVDAVRPLAGRYALAGAPVPTPTGELSRGVDLQSKAPVQVLVVDAKALPTPTLADRAIREIKQLAKVKSEKVLKILDQGKTDDGRVFVVSEVPEGPTLDELIQREGALPLERARAILLGVGEALAEAQKVGVIHRDLSPRNIIAGEHVRVTGFGVAEPVDDKVFGAPAFLSPEQAEGKPVDQRSNIYSLGALFYYMVTGSPPFDGSEGDRAATVDPMAIVQQHLHAQPVPPSHRREGLSPDVDRVVLKALEKSGGRRHLTLRQLLTEVEGLGAAPARAAVEVAATPPVTRQAEVAPESSMAAKTIMDLRPPAEARASSPIAAGPDAAAGARPEQAKERAKEEARAADPAVMPASTSRPVEDPAVATNRSAETPAAASPSSSPAAATLIGAFVNADTIDGAARRLGLSVPAPDAPAAVVEKVASGPERSVPTPLTDVKEKGGMALAATALPQPAQAPVAAPPAARPAAATTAAGKAGKKGFRETAWFKRGELEEELARKAAEVVEGDPLAGPSQTEAVVDESTLTVDDRQRLSLKTGRTEMMPALKAQAIPGERMSDEEMLAEMDPSRRWMVYAGAAIGVLAVLTAVYFLFFRSAPTH